MLDRFKLRLAQNNGAADLYLAALEAIPRWPTLTTIWRSCVRPMASGREHDGISAPTGSSSPVQRKTGGKIASLLMPVAARLSAVSLPCLRYCVVQSRLLAQYRGPTAAHTSQYDSVHHPRQPAPAHHLIARGLVRHIAVVCVRTIIERAIDLYGIDRTHALAGQEHADDRLVFKYEARILLAGGIALDGAATEEMRVAKQRRNVEAAHRRRATLRGGVRFECLSFGVPEPQLGLGAVDQKCVLGDRDMIDPDTNEAL